MKNFGLVLISVALILAFRPDLLNRLFDQEQTSMTSVPSKALQERVTPIYKTKINHTDAKRLSEFYGALADVIFRDENSLIKSSAEVRLINERSGRLCFERTGISGRYPQLAEEIDTVIGYGIGSKHIDGQWESVEINSGNRQGLVDALKAVAWACEQSSALK
jgi:hypothetical protein